jgi:hypothetical protein
MNTLATFNLGTARLENVAAVKEAGVVEAGVAAAAAVSGEAGVLEAVVAAAGAVAAEACLGVDHRRVLGTGVEALRGAVGAEGCVVCYWGACFCAVGSFAKCKVPFQAWLKDYMAWRPDAVPLHSIDGGAWGL